MIFRNSLRRNLVLLSVAVLALYYVLVSLFSILFMEPYYLHKVERTLISAYNTLNQMDELDLSTVSQLETSNLSIVIADAETMEILYNSQMPDRFMPDMMSRVLPMVKEQTAHSPTGYRINTNEEIRHTTSGTQSSGGRRVSLGGVTDRFVLDISTSYASISQAAEISIEFSLIVGLMLMVLAALVFSKMSTTVTQPMTQITNVANKIAHLDFSEKCTVSSGSDEIGLMADSINTMSDFMQSHIAQLEAANEQLKADIQQKKEQEEARKNLVANLSHDLKTPIGLISGYADGLRHGMAKTEAEMNEYCDVICDETDRMMLLIQKMMELFRLESGTVKLEREEFDLSDLLNYQIEIFSMELERGGVEFSADFGSCLYVTTDYFSAEQVLTNYMQNAITHRSGGNVIRLWVTEQETSYRVSIYNSSAPIPSDEAAHIWDSFYRMDKSRTRSRRESGLGLSIVKSNMELLGGDYGMENAEGGVIFWAEFPKSQDV